MSDPAHILIALAVLLAIAILGAAILRLLPSDKPKPKPPGKPAPALPRVDEDEGSGEVIPFRKTP